MRRAMVVAEHGAGTGGKSARTGLDLRRAPPVARRACCAPRRTSARLWPRRSCGREPGAVRRTDPALQRRADPDGTRRAT
jgi:hypothetical protein